MKRIVSTTLVLTFFSAILLASPLPDEATKDDKNKTPACCKAKKCSKKKGCRKCKKGKKCAKCKAKSTKEKK